jgi:hypothetical protein
MPRELCFRGGSVVAEKEAARDGQPGVAYFIGIARIAGEAVPSRQIEFRFRAIDDGFLEGNREANGRVVDLVVIRVVVNIASEVVGVQSEFVEESLGQAEFVVVSLRRLQGILSPPKR